MFRPGRSWILICLIYLVRASPYFTYKSYYTLYVYSTIIYTLCNNTIVYYCKNLMFVYIISHIQVTLCQLGSPCNTHTTCMCSKTSIFIIVSGAALSPVWMGVGRVKWNFAETYLLFINYNNTKVPTDPSIFYTLNIT